MLASKIHGAQSPSLTGLRTQGIPEADLGVDSGHGSEYAGSPLMLASLVKRCEFYSSPVLAIQD